jgi:hypothetical protein
VTTTRTCRMETLRTMTLADFAYLRHYAPAEVLSDEPSPLPSLVVHEPGYTIGWTELKDEDWEGLQWETKGFSNLDAAITHSKQLAANNKEWRFIVINDDEVNFDVMWDSTGAS